MRPWYIYILREPTTGDVRYVGKTVRLNSRAKEHLKIPPVKDQSYRARWIRSLRAQQLKPIMEVIETGAGEGHAEAEIHWIAQFRNQGARLTNSTIGGEGVIGLNDEIRAKMSAALKGRRHPPEWRYRSAEAHRSLKRKLTPEHKAKWMAGRDAYVHTPEHRKRISDVSRNRIVGIGTRQKISNLHKGKSVSTETRQRLSESCSGRKHSVRELEKMKRAWEYRKLRRDSFPEMGVGRGKPGAANHQAKLSEELVNLIRNQHSSVKGERRGYRVLGRLYNISWETVRNVIKRKTWNHIP